MREPCPDWSPLGVIFKILDEHPHLFLYSSSPPPPPGSLAIYNLVAQSIDWSFSKLLSLEITLNAVYTESEVRMSVIAGI